MRQRPLCVAFLLLITFIITSKALGLTLWNQPDGELRAYAKSLKGQNVVLYGTVTERQEKANTTSYFLEDSLQIKNATYKSVNTESPESYDTVPLHGIRLYVPKEEDYIMIGSRIVIFGEVSVYENASNPGGFDAADYYAADDCCISVYTSSFRVVDAPAFSFGEFIANIKERMGDGLEASMDTDSAAILLAMLTGDRSELTEDIKLDYSAAGISHLLSISGMHVAIIGGFIYKLLTKSGVCIKKACAVTIAAAVFYCIFTGAGDSTLRATIMLVVMYGAKITLKSYDGISALSLAGLIILGLRPAALFRAGFQLSFAAAAAIILVSPVIKDAVLSKKTKKSNLLEAGVTWISVNLVIFPLVLYHFSEFAVYSVITNIIFVPLMSVTMITGLAGAALCLFAPVPARVVLMLPGLILYLQDRAGELILKLPYSTLILGRPAVWQLALAAAGVVLFVILVIKKRTARSYIRLAPLALVVLCAVRLPEGFSITALDVGQGDCLFIRDGGTVYMVDGGSSSESEVGRYTILPYIKSQGISRIEGVFLTHNDSDHYSGISELFVMIANNRTAVKINCFMIPAWLAADEEGQELVRLAQSAEIKVILLQGGDSITVNNTEIKILSPNADDGLTGNEGSLVLSVEYGAFSALLTGDLEGEGEELLTGTLGHYDYLKVAHHGSKNSGSAELYKELSPSLCVISAPEDSIYGHPHAETLELIEAAGADYLQTGLCGAVRISVGSVKNSTFICEAYML